MSAGGGGARLVAPGLDRSINDYQWSADGRSIVASYEQDGKVTVSRIGLDGRVTPITHDVGGGGLDRPYAGGGFSVARNGTIAFTSDTRDRPAELMVSSGGKARQLTRLNDLSLSGKNLGTLREIIGDRARRRQGAELDSAPADPCRGTARPDDPRDPRRPLRRPTARISRPITSSTRRPAMRCSTPIRAGRPAMARRSPTGSRRPIREAISTI